MDVFFRNVYNFNLTGDTVVIDIGANIGLASLFFASKQNVIKVKDMFYGGLVIRQFLAISRMSNEHDEVNKELEKSKQRFLLFTSSVNIHESKRIFI